MSESLQIASWNIADGLSRPEVADAVVERIIAKEANIVVLPEAASEAVIPTAQERDALSREAYTTAVERFHSEGYAVRTVPYADTDGRKDRHVFSLLTRGLPKGSTARAVDLRPRFVLGLDIPALNMAFVGLHLDDRQEATRLKQAEHVLQEVQWASTVLLAGDLNAMYARGPWARPLRWIQPLTNYLPAVDPGETAPNLPELRRVGSLAQRLTGMATGDTMRYLTEQGFAGVDPACRPTRGPVQIDHILSNFHLQPSSHLKIDGYMVEDVPLAESDHRLLGTTVHY